MWLASKLRKYKKGKKELKIPVCLVLLNLLNISESKNICYIKVLGLLKRSCLEFHSVVFVKGSAISCPIDNSLQQFPNDWDVVFKFWVVLTIIPFALFLPGFLPFIQKLYWSLVPEVVTNMNFSIISGLGLGVWIPWSR